MQRPCHICFTWTMRGPITLALILAHTKRYIRISEYSEWAQFSSVLRLAAFRSHPLPLPSPSRASTVGWCCMYLTRHDLHNPPQSEIFPSPESCLLLACGLQRMLHCSQQRCLALVSTNVRSSQYPCQHGAVYALAALHYCCQMALLSCSV